MFLASRYQPFETAYETIAVDRIFKIAHNKITHDVCIFNICVLVKIAIRVRYLIIKFVNRFNIKNGFYIYT